MNGYNAQPILNFYNEKNDGLLKIVMSGQANFPFRTFVNKKPRIVFGVSNYPTRKPIIKQNWSFVHHCCYRGDVLKPNLFFLFAFKKNIPASGQAFLREILFILSREMYLGECHQNVSSNCETATFIQCNSFTIRFNNS